jgi:hypothetical protein
MTKHVSREDSNFWDARESARSNVMFFTIGMALFFQLQNWYMTFNRTTAVITIMVISAVAGLLLMDSRMFTIKKSHQQSVFSAFITIVCILSLIQHLCLAAFGETSDTPLSFTDRSMISNMNRGVIPQTLTNTLILPYMCIPAGMDAENTKKLSVVILWMYVGVVYAVYLRLHKEGCDGECSNDEITQRKCSLVYSVACGVNIFFIAMFTTMPGITIR